MKLIWITTVLLIFGMNPVFAKSDSSAYEAQRKKINQLLTERSSRFGQYEISLGKRTGIFGLKTKKDMQFSNDILRQIVLTDNDIFSELKILLDYKDLEKEQVKIRAETVEGRIDRFQTTITGLQQENEKLRAETEKKNVENDKKSIYLLVLVVSLFASLAYIFKSKILPKINVRARKNT
jgi:hypothetical protein